MAYFIRVRAYHIRTYPPLSSRLATKMSDRAQPPSDERGDDGDEPEIPPSIELAWGLRDRGTRGRKPGLTLDRIVAAGIKVALTDGLGALSMARVARELGVGTMSLYRYVAAKDELLTLMVDAALGSPPAPSDAEEDWRTGVTRWAVGLRDAYRRHPWSLRVPISAPPLGPNNIAWLDAMLRSLATTPLSEQEKLSTVLLVSGFVRNDATLTADFAAAAGGEPVMPGYGRLLARLTDAAGYPALHRAIASGALDDEDDIDAEFGFGLQRILDGTEALIRRIPARPGGP
jgi:AcrR family transcriptional regulator